VATRERPADRGRRRARAAFRSLGEEHRRARVGSGLSLRAVGTATGTSHQQVQRFESGRLRLVDLEQLGAWCAVVGLDFVLRGFPGNDAVRDAGQQRLLGRLNVRLQAALRWRTEVPLQIAGDLRAWDAVIEGHGWQLAVEAESVLDDLQALERRLTLKVRDGRVANVLLLIADTRRNRRGLESSPAAFGDFDRDARTTLARLSRGELPGRRCLVFL
jgi:transcriptional regulator with XRE-family HTH domain